MEKNNIAFIEKELKNKKIRIIALVAPSFVSTFDYPSLIVQLKKLGFDKVVELTFGAKMINREYHKILKENPKKLFISSTCPGIVYFIREKYPKLNKNIIRVDSPMIAMGKICKKAYPKHKTCFISPCEFKKTEAEKSNCIDYVIDYKQLADLFSKNKINASKERAVFDSFYNDYTKIYPLSGGLSKTAHLKGVLKNGEEKIIDGIKQVEKFLENPDSKARFLDFTFCTGGCIGGLHTAKIPVYKKRKKLMKYLNTAKKEKIPAGKTGIIERAKGIRFRL